MARRNTKRVRFDGMQQHKQRQFKKKNSPQGRKDSRDWTYFTLKKIRGETADVARDSSAPR
jgi:hypothetical protein